MVALKIKLFLTGRKNARSFRLVVSPINTRRGGRTVAVLGGFKHRDTHKVDFSKVIDVEVLKLWLSRGAVPTEKASHIVQAVLKG